MRKKWLERFHCWWGGRRGCHYLHENFAIILPVWALELGNKKGVGCCTSSIFHIWHPLAWLEFFFFAAGKVVSSSTFYKSFCKNLHVTLSCSLPLEQAHDPIIHNWFKYECNLQHFSMTQIATCNSFFCETSCTRNCRMWL